MSERELKVMRQRAVADFPGAPAEVLALLEEVALWKGLARRLVAARAGNGDVLELAGEAEAALLARR